MNLVRWLAIAAAVGMLSVFGASLAHPYLLVLPAIMAKVGDLDARKKPRQGSRHDHDVQILPPSF